MRLNTLLNKKRYYISHYTGLTFSFAFCAHIDQFTITMLRSLRICYMHGCTGWSEKLAHLLYALTLYALTFIKY